MARSRFPCLSIIFMTSLMLLRAGTGFSRLDGVSAGWSVTQRKAQISHLPTTAAHQTKLHRLARLSLPKAMYTPQGKAMLKAARAQHGARSRAHIGQAQTHLMLHGCRPRCARRTHAPLKRSRTQPVTDKPCPPSLAGPPLSRASGQGSTRARATQRQAWRAAPEKNETQRDKAARPQPADKRLPYPPHFPLLREGLGVAPPGHCSNPCYGKLQPIA
jgi:hypothetical protein